MFLVFDIGGTNMRVAVSSDGKTIAQSKIVPTPKDFNQGIETLKQIADALSGSQKIQAAAGGLAGVLDKDKTMLLQSPHIGGWVGKNFKKALEQILNAPIFLENDADLAALGEACFGAGVSHNIVAYLTISTGVGGGRVVNKKIDQNALGFEPGHQIIVIDGKLCNCGGKGHLESYIAGAYIDKTSPPSIWDEAANYLAIGLHNTIVHWSPDIVILGGSVVKSIAIEKVRVHLQDILTIFPQTPEITQSKLGDSAGLYGALQILRLRSGLRP